jgi:dTDP-4-amino-4,6-dideoxygalactose transaminase
VKRLQDLAVLGGPPLFAERLHVGRPNVPDRAQLFARIEQILDRRWFTNDGPCVRELETKLAERIGVRNCVTMCNGTVALEIAIRALGLTGEVIVPSLTFVATAHALQWQQITPVFCDVDPATYTIDPVRAQELVTPRTSGIIGVHLWGRACDVDTLSYIARRHDLVLLFDAAHAFACSHHGRTIGSFGRAEVFSFHATKVFSTFEGGAVTTDDDALAQRMRLMRNFGFGDYDDVVYVGTNGKMSEVAAAMGLVSLAGLDDVIAVNRANHERYRERLTGIAGLKVLAYDPRERSNYQYVVLEIEPEITGIARDRIVEVLWAERVMARRYFHPGCHRMEPYRSYFPHAGLLLPETERVASRLLSLPTGTAVTRDDVDAICDLLRLVLSEGPRVEEQLSRRAAEALGRRAHA